MLYCRNCGSEMGEKDTICEKCGVQVGAYEKYCQSCGSKTSPGESVCQMCSAVLVQPEKTKQKSKLIAGLLGILLGAFGLHNYYLGYKSKGSAQVLITILSLGYLGIISLIWGLVEGNLILTGKIDTDFYGVALKK